MCDLNIVWYGLIGFLFTGYAILDGFDLGVGALHLLTKTDQQRRLMLNSIGPLWDGNEVWLVAAGGALFAAFPHVYATVFSGFYLAFMLLLAALIFRVAAIEFRSRFPSHAWRQLWDVSFSVSSILVALLAGVAMGNIIWGIPLNEKHEFTGTFFSLLHPYALLTGITTVVLFTMHGCIYAILKNEGELQQQLRRVFKYTLIAFVLCYILTTAATLLYVPRMMQQLSTYPVLYAIPALTVLAILNIPRELYRGREFRAFLSSCAIIVGLMLLFAIGIFPNIVLSNPNPENSLNIYNSASTAKTLQIMLIIVLIGMPFVLAYSSFIHWVFRGKTKVSEADY